MFNPTISDIWKRVIYTSFSWTEEWILKNYNDEKKVAIVVYNYNNDPDNYEDYTWEMTNYTSLKFKK